MFTRFDANKSTKGASKLRRDLINAEIANLRDLLPLPPSTRQRLSQLQLMALVCVYVRKANYFQQAFKRHDSISLQTPTPNIGFSKALNGFLMMMTQNGKLLYISDNAAEYLGHSMEDLLIHGDSVYDIIDKQDHQAIQVELGRTPGSTPSYDDTRIFLCRMNVSRNARRQMRFGDQKVVLIQGHYLSFLPLCSRNEPVFLATCTPIAMPETRECVVQGATNVFTSIHSMDMKFIHIDKNGEFHLGYPRNEVQNASWYRLLHWDCLREAQIKHRLITQSEQDRSCILLVRLQRRSGDWLYVHCVLQVKENMENSQQPVIVCTNQVLSEQEATVMQANSWLYHYYMVQSKLQYGLAYDTNTSSRMVSYYQSPAHQPRATIPMPSFVQHHESPIASESVHHVNDRSGYSHSPGPHSAGGHIHTHHHHTVQHLSDGVTHQRQHLQQTFPGEKPLRIDSEPVDYSIHHSVHHSASKRSPDNYQHLRSSPTSVHPYGKRKPKYNQNHTELELLKINDSVDSPPEEIIVDLDTVSTASCGGDGGLLCVMPVLSSTTSGMQHALNKPRLMLKMGTTADPADFMEQWNPSPPWSDTLQKVPDIMHHDLSPYVTTTPPTPTGTPGETTSNSHLTFTFDWMPEQYVPNLTGPPVKTVSEEDHYHNVMCWSSESHNHRIFSLQPPPRGHGTDGGNGNININGTNVHPNTERSNVESPKHQQSASPSLPPSSEHSRDTASNATTATATSCVDSC